MTRSARTHLRRASTPLILWATAVCAEPDRPARVEGAAADPTSVIERALERYLIATSSRDTVAIRESYVADGRFVWMESGQIAYRTVDEVLQGLASLPPETVIRTDLGDLTVVPVAGGGAHSWATFTTTVGEGPNAFSFGGIMSLVWEQAGERWLIVGGHTSSPQGG